MTRCEKTDAIKGKCQGIGCGDCRLQYYLNCNFVNYRDEEIDHAYELMFGVPESESPAPTIKDSGERRAFETGAVRDIQEGKGRCDLMPLGVISNWLTDPTLITISRFVESGDMDNLYIALDEFRANRGWDYPTTLLEVSKHFEEGAKKYGEHNWQKGIPVKCYIDSAVRHYLKWLRGDKDEPHDRAFVWNILCCIWTCENKPSLNDYQIVQNNNENKE